MFLQVLVWRLGGGRSPKLVGACLRKGRATSAQQAAKPNPKTRSIPEPEGSHDTRTRKLARYQNPKTRSIPRENYALKKVSQKEDLTNLLSSEKPKLQVY